MKYEVIMDGKSTIMEQDKLQEVIRRSFPAGGNHRIGTKMNMLSQLNICGITIKPVETV